MYSIFHFKVNTTLSTYVPFENQTLLIGTCGVKDQTLLIQFYSTWSLSFVFTKDSNATAFTYHLTVASLGYNVDSSIFLHPLKSGKYSGTDILLFSVVLKMK